MDWALDELSPPSLFADPLTDDCRVGHIPKRSERSVSSDQMAATDHAAWVFTCRLDSGNPSRYFQLASDLTDELVRIGASFEVVTSYVGDPGGLLETRWTVAGSVLSGEIEMLTVPGVPDTLTILVLKELRGTWPNVPAS